MANGDSLGSFVGGGMDTARVRGDQEDVERRQREARDARGNLAAMMCERQAGAPSVRGLARPKKERIERAALERIEADPQLQRGAADQWALLLEMLGLNVLPEHLPGRCRNEDCGRPLPISAASASSHGSSPYFKAGYCSARCWGLS